MRLTKKQLATLQRMRTDAEAMRERITEDTEPDAWLDLGGIVARAEDMIAQHHAEVAFEATRLPSAAALIRGLESLKRRMDSGEIRQALKKGEE